MLASEIDKGVLPETVAKSVQRNSGGHLPPFGSDLHSPLDPPGIQHLSFVASGHFRDIRFLCKIEFSRAVDTQMDTLRKFVFVPEEDLSGIILPEIKFFPAFKGVHMRGIKAHPHIEKVSVMSQSGKGGTVTCIPEGGKFDETAAP